MVDALDIRSATVRLAVIRLAVLDLNLTVFDGHIIDYQQIFPAFFRRIV
jgi:hypothetical protein